MPPPMLVQSAMGMAGHPSVRGEAVKRSAAGGESGGADETEAERGRIEGATGYGAS